MTSPPSRLNPSFIFKATRAWWLGSFFLANANWKTDSRPHRIAATSKRATKNTLFQNLDDFLFFFLAIKVSRDALIRQDGLGNNTAKADLDEFYAKTQ